jgi:hypothetical protein
MPACHYLIREGERKARASFLQAISSSRLCCFLLLAFPLLAFELPQSSPSTSHSQASEYQVKAAFLLNFTKFIDWPDSAFESAGSPMTICLLGDDPFDGALNQVVEGEVVNGRNVAIQKIRRPPAPKSCQVLFVSKSEKDVPKLLSGLGPGVLTVGEGEGFIRDGGMIAFVLENRRVRFVISQTAAANASLSMSSRLLNVAKVVEK